jgi:hypothetical protein
LLPTRRKSSVSTAVDVDSGNRNCPKAARHRSCHVNVHGALSSQSRLDEFANSLAPPGTAGEAPQKARRPAVEAALLFDA